ncbi:MAG TPA: hypothetical protein VJ044_18150, partial [Candidatus Hodarchaeales archaeon]|nr:hypothetical protein [Candidatus Hodarchaeales archaeon]
ELAPLIWIECKLTGNISPPKKDKKGDIAKLWEAYQDSEQKPLMSVFVLFWESKKDHNLASIIRNELEELGAMKSPFTETLFFAVINGHEDPGADGKGALVFQKFRSVS